jgi:hypothetical protein
LGGQLFESQADDGAGERIGTVDCCCAHFQGRQTVVLRDYAAHE